MRLAEELSLTVQAWVLAAMSMLWLASTLYPHWSFREMTLWQLAWTFPTFLLPSPLAVLGVLFCVRAWRRSDTAPWAFAFGLLMAFLPAIVTVLMFDLYGLPR